MAATNSITLDCGNLRIAWQRVHDRWQHAIGLFDKNAFQQVAKSVEGTPEDLWPTSPVLQELHVEQRGKASVAFLTGMAGKSHWSASILCEPENHRATFEIACRCKQNPEWIGSLYQTPEWLEVCHSEHSLSMSLPHDRRQIVATTSDLLGSVPQFDEQRNECSEAPWTASFLNRAKGMRRTILFAPRWEPAEKTRTLLWKYSFEAITR